MGVILMQDRRTFLSGAARVAGGLAMSSGSVAAQAAKAPRRPNIILIMADDMGYSDIGCFGGEIDTPNIDRLAAGGLRFSQYYNAPRCCPSRASLLTGLYPHQANMAMMTVDHGRYPAALTAYDCDLNKDAVTIAEMLKGAGYTTMMSGKWHITPFQETALGEKVDDKSNWPVNRGFDKFYGFIGGVSDYFTPAYVFRGDQQIEEKDPNFYLTDGITDNAVDMLKDAGKAGKPFFLYAAYNAPHWPLQAPEQTVAKYRGRYALGWDALREQRHAKQLKMQLLSSAWSMGPRDPRVPGWDRASFKAWEIERMAVYAAQVDIMDQGIGRIVAQLEKMGQLDNTLIFFMSDNGGNYEETDEVKPGAKREIWMPERTKTGAPVIAGNDPKIMPGPATTFQSYGGPWANLSNTPFRLYKHFAHEGGISVPLVAHWPNGIAARGAITHQVSHEIDILKTCLDVSGAEFPKQAVSGKAPIPPEGRSLRPVFSGGRVDDRGMLFWEHEGNCAVRDGQWKLVSAYPNTWELYDMEADRTELHDLSAAQPQVVVRLAQAYRDWAARVGAQPWPLPQTPAGQQGGQLPLPKYLKADRT